MRVGLLRAQVRFSPLLPRGTSPALPSAPARHLFTQHPDQAYGDGLEGAPRFLLLDGFLGRTLIEQARQTRRAVPATQGELLASIQGPASKSLKGALERIVRDVKGLREAASALRHEDTYRQGRAVTEDLDPPVLKARATDGVGAAPGSFTVLRLARSHEVASDPRPNPGTALGLRGVFRLGTVEVPVLAGDTLQSLADRINAGEDANRNGRLDGAEDRNFSRTLDPYEDANGNGRLETGEDLDADGALDPGEDLNRDGLLGANEDLDHDFRLGGGTALHGVQARVLEGRLLLRRAEAGPLEIEVADPDNLLTTLGFIEVGYLGDAVFSDVRQQPSDASVSRDGKEIRLDANTSSSLLQGVDLELRREGGPVGVSVARDPSGAVKAVRAFVEEYNRVVGDLNGLLDDGGVAAREPRVQRFRMGLERAAGDPLSPPALAGGAGLQARNQEDETFSEPQILGALDRLRRGLGGIFDRAHGLPSAAGHLDQLGIRGLADDTLSLDEDTLAASLGRDPEGVRSLLGDPATGIGARVEAAVDAAAGSSGSLPRFRRALGGVEHASISRSIQELERALQAGRESELIAVA